MSRSVWKGPFVNAKLLSMIKKKEYAKKSVIKLWSKNSCILPEFIGFVFNVYNGSKFINIVISEPMIGKKIGEFIETRKFIKHASNKK